MFDYRITIQNDGVTPATGMVINGNNAPVEFTYAQLDAGQKATYDAFVAMVKAL